MLLKTAYSSKRKCFVCGTQNALLLKSFNKESIGYAFRKYEIVIKKHALCCLRHLDSDRRILDVEYSNIRVRETNFTENEVFLMRSNAEVRINQLDHGIIDQFRNMSTLTEELCYEITRWTKRQFTEFSGHIISIRNTKERKKEELIAIYRYWLTRGLLQGTIAKLKIGCNQRKISHYLQQIRDAIVRDFVPHFLGADRPREFYLQRNNASINELFQLNGETVCVIVDGTYTRTQKSRNNKFQYESFSKYKGTNLLKPFIMACPDGWIVDCYGPWKAAEPEASIMRYVLETDPHVQNILLPDKTIVFLDRGLRDVRDELQETYRFKVHIPTCEQLETDGERPSQNRRNQLTVQQTSQTRLCTKVRWIIEKINSRIKNYKSLDNISNNEIGHIQIDYRIACAMINFTHVAECPDGNQAVEVARRLREITSRPAAKQINRLLPLMRKTLNTTDVPNARLDTIDDFPRLSIEQLTQHIFLGTYQVKQCISYIQEMVARGFVSRLSQNAIVKLEDLDLRNELEEIDGSARTKCIGFEIVSRYHRSKKNASQKDKALGLSDSDGKKINAYKLFIQYEPRHNTPGGIKRWICSCPGGLRIAGCCNHVAVVLYYLCYGKYSEITTPGEHLNNVYIRRGQPANRPVHIRHRRRLFFN